MADNQQNRPHRKSKEKKERAPGGTLPPCIFRADGRLTLLSPKPESVHARPAW